MENSIWLRIINMVQNHHTITLTEGEFTLLLEIASKVAIVDKLEMIILSGTDASFELNKQQEELNELIRNSELLKNVDECFFKNLIPAWFII